MTRWTHMTADEIAKVSARNRASRTHRLEDANVGGRPKKALGASAPLPPSTSGPGTQPTPLEIPNFATSEAAGTYRKRHPSRTRISEHAEQVMVVQWWDEIGAAQYGLDYRLLIAVPNGGARDPVTGRKLKDEGVRAGVPDLLLAVPCSGYRGLFVEMKAVDGNVRPHQADYHFILRAQGYGVKVARGFDEARRVIEDYLSAV